MYDSNNKASVGMNESSGKLEFCRSEEQAQYEPTALSDKELDEVTGGAYQVTRVIAIRGDGKNMQMWVTQTT